MNAVILDGYTLNSGDLDWKKLEAPGMTLTVYDRTPAAEVLNRCSEAEIVISNKVVFTADLLRQLPSLKLISVLATGYNVIDTAAARQFGIVVCNVPAYGTASVAQHTLALLLELTNQPGRHSVDVHKGGWTGSPDWCYSLSPLMELDHKTMGIVGWGNIGRQVARLAGALGMEVLFHTPSPKDGGALGKYTSLESLFTNSDVISLHCPLVPANTAFVNSRLLNLMKRDSILINTARGQLINEIDLAEALNKGQIRGAALDVLSSEPPSADNPLLSAKNCIITPHNAWMTVEARQRVLQITADNLKAFLNGHPVNRVN